jgi:hypothetical protein
MGDDVEGKTTKATGIALPVVVILCLACVGLGVGLTAVVGYKAQPPRKTQRTIALPAYNDEGGRRLDAYQRKVWEALEKMPAKPHGDVPSLTRLYEDLRAIHPPVIAGQRYADDEFDLRWEHEELMRAVSIELSRVKKTRQMKLQMAGLSGAKLKALERRTQLLGLRSQDASLGAVEYWGDTIYMVARLHGTVPRYDYRTIVNRFVEEGYTADGYPPLVVTIYE